MHQSEKFAAAPAFALTSKLLRRL